MRLVIANSALRASLAIYHLISNKRAHGIIVNYLVTLNGKISPSRSFSKKIQLFWGRLSEKVHATILKGIVGDFKCTVFQRNLKESYGRPLIYVCECWRKVTKVGSTATVVRNSVLIISHITFRDCRVHFILDKLSRNSCIYVDFKAQGNALYRCHGNVILEENVMWEIYDGYLIPWPNFVLIWLP